MAFASKWLPADVCVQETPGGRTAKTDKRAFVGFVSDTGGGVLHTQTPEPEPARVLAGPWKLAEGRAALDCLVSWEGALAVPVPPELEAEADAAFSRKDLPALQRVVAEALAAMSKAAELRQGAEI